MMLFFFHHWLLPTQDKVYQNSRLVVRLFVFIKLGEIVGHLKYPTFGFDEAFLKICYCRNQDRDRRMTNQKKIVVKNIREMEVATKVYIRKLWKNQKDGLRIRFRVRESVTHKVLELFTTSVRRRYL